MVVKTGEGGREDWFTICVCLDAIDELQIEINQINYRCFGWSVSERSIMTTQNHSHSSLNVVNIVKTNLNLG